MHFHVQEVLQPSALSKIRAFLVCANSAVMPGRSTAIRAVPRTALAAPLGGQPPPASEAASPISGPNSAGRARNLEPADPSSGNSLPNHEPVTPPLPALRKPGVATPVLGSAAVSPAGAIQGRELNSLLSTSSSRRFRGYTPGDASSGMVSASCCAATSLLFLAGIV